MTNFYFLPHHYDPIDLFLETSPFLLEPRNNELRLTTRTRMNHDDEDENLRSKNGDICNKHGTVVDDEKLKIVALEVANASHASYSGWSPSGVALVDCDRKLYKGSNIESVAFNPSLGPVQVAMVVGKMRSQIVYPPHQRTCEGEGMGAVVAAEGTAVHGEAAMVSVRDWWRRHSGGCSSRGMHKCGCRELDAIYMRG
ncbi:hypothetical protein HN51_008450 [Arachis hypogaea]